MVFFSFEITSQTYNCVLTVIGGINEDGVHGAEQDVKHKYMFILRTFIQCSTNLQQRLERTNIP